MSLELLVFGTDAARVARAVAGGAAGVIVDWEWIGKERRQAGADTQISTDTVADLRRVRSVTAAPVVVRINGLGPWTAAEIDAAIAAGADELLVPMVRAGGEIDAVRRLAAERIAVGLLVETREAVRDIDEIARRPLSRLYVGLNDLAIDAGTRSIFEPLTDGTLERIREAAGSTPFGFGGLTRPDRGHPLPCRLLLAEMRRLGCSFTFLRRSFWRDTGPRGDPAATVRAIASAAAALRCPSAVAADRAELVAHLGGELAARGSAD